MIIRWQERWGGKDLDQLIEQIESEIIEEDEADDEPVHVDLDVEPDE